MTPNPLIKICGIKTPELAEQAAKAGANFIGIVLHPQSKRYVSIEQAKTIAAASTENGATPVAVFVNHTFTQMQEICNITHIQTVQLQGDTARKQHSQLPKHYQRFYVRSVDNDNEFNGCDPHRDYLLFDNKTAGSGKTFNWNALNYTGCFRIGIAGGLTVDNIVLAINKFHPAIVDVSTGVEDASGEKNIFLIQKFIKSVNNLKRELT
ncbi:hypothetical protein AYO45_05230 [Gammaproteobacteria bacterium SCGC AG-212-F23]|nr:hypothetical protein AYO45_05230 [Gammaproteobacteria bacterium SCGC AG-212-F23]